jgi:two-component system sensor histidine kinase MtrB
MIFAFGALLLSGLLASIAYLSVRSSIVSEERTADVRQVVANAVLVRDELRSPTTDRPGLVASLDTAPASASLLFSGGEWFPSSPSVGPSELPHPLEQLVVDGKPARQTYLIRGAPELVVGVPVVSEGAAYFEFFSLRELDRTLHVLLAALVVGALVTTAGGAIVGRWAAGRAVRPLRDVSDAALAIAGGQLDTRLEVVGDRDLESLTTSFNQMADRLQRRIERDARFTSDVSHELRSPLTTLSAALSVLDARRTELGDRTGRAVDLLGDEIRRFRTMVTELLEISSFDAGSADLVLDDVEAGELIAHAVARSVEPAARIEVGDEASHLHLVTDKRRFERVIANLVENADRYAGGVTVIRVEATMGGDGQAAAARFSVEDHGPGVEPEEQERIFERFSRGSAARRRGAGSGTGLGLALVSEHVKLLGGRIGVEAPAEGGARFVVELPAVLKR